MTAANRAPGEAPAPAPPGTDDAGGPPALAPRARLLRCALAWGLVALASPGILTPDGSALLATAGVAVWGLAAHRPGKRAKLAEWVPAALGWAVVFGWSAYVFWGGTAYLSAGKATYLIGAGALLRRLARRAPLGVAVPAAFLFVETLCAVLPQPFGMPWMRLGVHLHAWPALAGSARVWGFAGLSLVLAALAGLVVEVAATRRVRPLAAVVGLGPLALAFALAAITAPPESRPGPRLLLVQPGVPQARKMRGADPRTLLREAVELTARGLAELERTGAPPPDLVAWGETMLYLPVMGTGLRRAMERGEAEPAPWLNAVRAPGDVDLWRQLEEQWVRDLLVSGRGDGAAGAPRRGVLPVGTSFLSGAELYVARDGRLRRQNAVLVWDPEGRRVGGPDGEERASGKIKLVSSAETMHGLERFQWVRDVIYSIAGYVPDLLRADRTETLWFEARDGARYALGASVCFDNAFDDPFLGPAERGPLDFHLVVSNEAWFRTSHEMDQMIAFSRLEAIQTGRAVVRATNSGVTCAIDARGRDVARLVVDGRDRATTGTLAVQVPVPATEAGRSARTPFVSTRLAWLALWLAAGPLLALRRPRGARARKRGNRPAPSG